MAAAWLGPLVAVAQEATREHLAIPANPPSEVDRDNALAGAWIEATARNFQPTDQEIETYYKAHNREFEQAKARHILISYSTAFASRSNRSEADAKMRIDEIARQLKQGIQFSALAIRQSDDPYTREIGGDLAYVSHHQLEPALDEAIWSQAPGQISAPFKGRFGYEIVQVEEKRVQPLAGVRVSIIGKMKAAALERKQQEIVAAVHFGLTPAFADSPLPCQPRRFTLTDSLREP
jgi:parvulin-like peptidyl-prolyl isomerase